VLRFFSDGGKELLPRSDGVYAPGAVAARLCKALQAAGRPVPAYLRLAAEELDAGPGERAVFSMACFWRGEGVLGSIQGVRSTRAGRLAGREVVEVEYAPERVSFSELLTLAHTEGCADRVWVPRGARLEEARRVLGRNAGELDEEPRPAAADDHEYYLRRSPYGLLPLTPLQRVRVNARLADARDAQDLLSPDQRALLARVRDRGLRPDGSEPPTDVEGAWRYRAELEARLRE